MWFSEEACQFSGGQTAQSLTCCIMEKPHTDLNDCLKILLSPMSYWVFAPNPTSKRQNNERQREYVVSLVYNAFE